MKMLTFKELAIQRQQQPQPQQQQQQQEEELLQFV